jgi:hypothetical protein
MPPWGHLASGRPDALLSKPASDLVSQLLRGVDDALLLQLSYDRQPHGRWCIWMFEEPDALAQVPAGEPAQARIPHPACIQHEGEKRGDPAAQHQEGEELQGLREEPRGRRALRGLTAPLEQTDADWQVSEDGKSGDRGEDGKSGERHGAAGGVDRH